jgi:hypothetical protein
MNKILMLRFVPVVLLLNAQKPTAVLFEAVLDNKAEYPIAVLDPPAVLVHNAWKPIAVLLVPTVLL